MNDNFEFDKIVLSIALSIFIMIFSDQLGNILYSPSKFIETRGYEIGVIDDVAAAAGVKKRIPEIIDIGLIMSSANASLGEAVFKKCAVCHTPNKGGVNKVGPNLWNIVSKGAALSDEFKYSSAMKQRGQDGKKWTYEELYRYLYAPKKYVPGTKMAFAGVKKDDERANLIAYLRTLADKKKPLPKPGS